MAGSTLKDIRDQHGSFEIKDTDLTYLAGVDESIDKVVTIKELTDKINSSVVPVSASTPEYTAFEVYATNEVITAGTTDSDTGLIYNEEVPIGMTHEFTLRSDNKKDSNDVKVDWGDGNVTELKNLNDSSVDVEGDKDTEEVNYHLSHTYSNPGKYVIKVTGRTYWGFKNGDNESNILSRVFDSDLPIASFVDNIAYMCRGGMKLLGVNIPTGQNFFSNIVNASGLFRDCKNLIYLNNFETKFIVTRTTSAACQNCINLVYSDWKLPILAPYKNDLGSSNMYYGCKNLGKEWTNLAGEVVKTTIENLIPFSGFVTKRFGISRCFLGCSSLTGTIPSSYLWEDSTKVFNSVDCFKDCSKEIREQAPTSWGGTNTDLDSKISNHFWNYMPVATVDTAGAVKVDGTTITIDGGVISAVTQAGGGSGSLGGVKNKLLDNVSIVSGNDNVIGGYSIGVRNYVASNTIGESYVEVYTLGNEGEDFDYNEDGMSDSDIDWSKITVGTVIYYLCNSMDDGLPIADEITKVDKANKRVYLKNKLVYTKKEYSLATGTYKDGTVYYSSAVSSNGTGRLVYTKMTAGTEYNNGDDIGSGIYTLNEVNTEISSGEDVGDIIAITDTSKGSDQSSYSFGYRNASVGNKSFSMGSYIYNAGISSMVVGINNSNMGAFSFVSGIGNTNEGDGVVSLGSNNKSGVGAHGSILIGMSNESYEFDPDPSYPQSGILIGTGNKNYAVNGANFGYNNESRGYCCINIGTRNINYGKNSMTFGYGSTNDEESSILIGNRGEIPSKVEWSAEDNEVRKYYKGSIVVSTSENQDKENVIEITRKNYWCNPDYNEKIVSGDNAEKYFYEDNKLIDINKNYKVNVGTVYVDVINRNKVVMELATSGESFDIDCSKGSYISIDLTNVTGVIPNPINCTDGQEILIKFIGDMSKVAIPMDWSKYKALPTSYGSIYNVFRLTSIKSESGDFDHFIEFIGGK